MHIPHFATSELKFLSKYMEIWYYLTQLRSHFTTENCLYYLVLHGRVRAWNCRLEFYHFIAKFSAFYYLLAMRTTLHLDPIVSLRFTEMGRISWLLPHSYPVQVFPQKRHRFWSYMRRWKLTDPLTWVQWWFTAGTYTVYYSSCTHNNCLVYQ